MALPATYIVPIVVCIVFILGCFGNGTLIFLIAKHKQLKTKRNAFLLNIAVADMLFAMVWAPVVGVTFGYPTSWILGKAICKINYFLVAVLPTVSIFTLTALTVERLTSLNDRFCNTMKRKVAAGIIALIWGISVCLGLPNLIFATERTYGSHKTTMNTACFIRETYTRLDILIRFVSQYAIPFLITVLCFILIAVSSRSGNQSQSSVPIEQNETNHSDGELPSSQEHSIHSYQFTKLVLCLVLVFLICWLPDHIYYMWFYYGRTEYSVAWHGFSVFATCLTTVDSCIRPWVVFGLDPKFKHYFKKHFPCCTCTKGKESVIPLDDKTGSPEQKASFTYN